MSRSLTRITARSFRRRDDALLDGRRRALDFRWWLEPGTWSFPALPRQEIDFVMNAALFVEPLQIRQKERLRGLHRLRRWPRRSSHGRDHSGYRPCTLTPRPAPKSIATLTDIGGVLSLLLFLRKRRSEVLEKNVGICSASSPRRIRTLATLTRRAGLPAWQSLRARCPPDKTGRTPALRRDWHAASRFLIEHGNRALVGGLRVLV
jgi:hypothetical protein